MSASIPALRKLTTTETKLFLREPAAAALTLGLPLALLTIFGLIPTMREPSAEFGGTEPFSTLIAPIAVSITITMLAISAFPGFLAGYRDKGMLRRLSVSPVHPVNLLLSQLFVHLMAAVVAIGLVLAAGFLVFDLRLPGNMGGWFLVLVTGMFGLFSIGMLIAAVVPNEKAANGVGMAVLLPMLALGGVWLPVEMFPDFLQRIAEVLPLGAMLAGFRETWAGGAPSAVALISLLAFGVVTTAAAARLFRWE
ncbi:ABC-2 type transport system permease protein [Tamaricihabitans halophyticus]|uniref:Transport permease protein n=1 Tax=Tamaricihabitans halophyticus TaxID=1262583 RepID=A0A4R2QD14_9PSEU|nr:ABC transporter permease [Tamaricihabitans halophyticus]TCP44795.1 ABC-2 type transport system permease protein [Tamaricihabitans halophyticus]